jgi:MFS family permease
MQVYGLSKTAAGGVLSTFALALIAGSPVLGWLANRFGRKSVLVGCSLVLAAVSGLMCWFVDSMTLPVLYLLFFCLFLTGGPVGPVVAAVSKELFPISISGTSVGTVNLFPFMGGAIFQVIIGAVLTAGSNAQGNYALIGFRYMFLICLGAALVSLVASFFMKETLGGPDT